MFLDVPSDGDRTRKRLIVERDGHPHGLMTLFHVLSDGTATTKDPIYLNKNREYVTTTVFSESVFTGSLIEH